MNTNVTTMDANLADKLINRVPHIILLYWVIKIASTTLGETGADMFSMTYNLGYGETILIFMGLFAVFLGIKLAIKRYEPITYWLTFTATAIAGTAISDFIDRTLVWAIQPVPPCWSACCCWCCWRGM